MKISIIGVAIWFVVRTAFAGLTDTHLSVTPGPSPERAAVVESVSAR